MVHCPYRYSQMLQHALASGKMRVAFLFGAGCPMSIRIPDGDTTTAPLIPDILSLTALVKEGIAKEPKETGHQSTLTQILEQFPASENPTIEHILSHIRLLLEVIRKDDLDGITQKVLKSLDVKMCAIITECVQASIPDNQPFSPYHQFAKWVSAIPRDYPVEIFTTNYDLLIEQSLEDQRVPYFDGFIGSKRAFFDLPSIEHDKLPPRWARLWKLHGSINWWKTNNGHIERRALSDAGEQQMIYPSHLKYDQSRRLPYLAMLDRMKVFLAPGKGPAVFVTCGYSFADQHLNELLLQSLRGNPSAVCYTLLFGNKEDPAYKEACDCAKRQPNLRLLAKNGAIIGTVEGLWDSDPKDGHPLRDYVTREAPPQQTPPTSGDSEVSATSKLLLGDFAYLGKFLLQQCDQQLSQEISTNPVNVAGN